MSDQVTIPFGQIPEDVRDQVSNHLLQYAVGLAGGQAGAPPNEMTIVGSGTLVQVGDLYAILTADHVIGCLVGTEEKCKGAGAIGVVLPHPGEEYEHNPLIIPIEELLQGKLIRIARDPEKREGAGPDLGAILLSDSHVSRIQKDKAFYNLSEGRRKILNDPLARERGVRLIFGFPAADTKWEQIGESSTYPPNFPSRALWGGAEEEPLPDTEGFDYFSVEIGEKEAGELPRDLSGTTTLGGISGGGVWHVPVFKNGEYRPDLMIEHSILRGVVFADLRLRTRDRILSVTCHGWRSVYEKAYTVLSRIAS